MHGNNTIENTTRNGLAVLELGGIDVPLAAGCSEPLAQMSVGVAAMHGKGGLDGAELPLPVRQPVSAHAVDFIIAMAIKREPRLRQWVREITVMGGSTTTGNYTPAAEFNIAADVEAAWTVFESGIPIRMVRLNITRRTGFDQGDIERMHASGRRVAGVIADLMQFYLGRQHASYGLNIAPMHDVCAIVPYVDDSLLQYLHTSARIELAGTYTRGMTMCDLRHPRGSAEPSGLSASTRMASIHRRR